MADAATTAYGLALKGAELALKEAEEWAASAIKDAGKAINKLLYPGEYRHKTRNAAYKAAMNALLNKAMDAAKAGDYVTAWAIAKAAADLAGTAPYKHWSQISGAVTQLGGEAQNLILAYGQKAGLQAASNVGGTFMKAAVPWIPIAVGAVALLFLMGGKKGNGK